MIIVVSDLLHAVRFGYPTSQRDDEHPTAATASESYVGMWIKPGTNFFEKDAEERWATIRSHSAVKKEWARYLDEGSMRETVTRKEVLTPKSQAKGKKGKDVAHDDATPGSLEEFDQKMAVDIVQGAADADILAEWLDNEKRPNVKAAIQKQLKAVKERDKLRKTAQEEVG